MIKKLITFILVFLLLLLSFVPFAFAAEDENVQLIDIQGTIHSQKHTIDNYAYLNSSYNNFSAFAQPMDGLNSTVDLCVPGLDQNDNYIPQGAVYCKKYNAVVISAYDSKGTSPSVLYLLDYSNGKMIAQFYLFRSADKPCFAHMGGIACSNNNLYFTDSASKISYIPIDNLAPNEALCKNILISGSINFASVINSSTTSYISCSNNMLCFGNYYSNASPTSYLPVTENYHSVLWSYTLSGSTSEEEWNNLKSSYKNPTFILPLDEYGIDKVQGAIIYNDCIYLSLSGGRRTNSTMFVGYMNFKNKSEITLAGKTHTVYEIIDYHSFIGIPMSEAIFVLDDYLFVLYESAAYKYNGATSSVSKEPTDVIWRFPLSALHDVSSVYHNEFERPFDNYFSNIIDSFRVFLNKLMALMDKLNIFRK